MYKNLVQIVQSNCHTITTLLDTHLAFIHIYYRHLAWKIKSLQQQLFACVLSSTLSFYVIIRGITCYEMAIDYGMHVEKSDRNPILNAQFVMGNHVEKTRKNHAAIALLLFVYSQSDLMNLKSTLSWIQRMALPSLWTIRSKSALCEKRHIAQDPKFNCLVDDISRLVCASTVIAFP